MTEAEIVAQVAAILQAEGITFMVVGSFASSIHGRPRSTMDADVVVDGSTAQIMRAVRGLAGSFYVSEDAAREAVARRDMFNAIHLDTGFKIDFIVRKARGFSIEELARRKSAMLGARAIPCASAEDTILVKLEWARRAGSARQYADACSIVEIQADLLDWSYLERWAPELGVADLLALTRRGEPFPGPRE